jgi:plasmid stabilization system protein ParE
MALATPISCEIRAYLRDRNPRGAERVRQRIQQSIAMLASFPGIVRATLPA